MGPQPVSGCHGGVQPGGLEQLRLGAGGEGGVAAGQGRRSDGLRADFVVRGVWEPDRDCLFDTRMIHAGSPGRASPQHISYQNALNTSAREKVKRYKAAAEERRATFCPLIVTVEGIAHQSMQAVLRRIAAGLSAKRQKPFSTISNWVRVRVQFALIKAGCFG